MSSTILHIGVGNFHRAHEAYYIHQLQQSVTPTDWKLCGAMLLPSDERLYRALKQQEQRYTLTICGRKGEDSCEEVRSISKLYWAMEQSEEILQLIAQPELRIISLTITEGGYNMDKATGEFLTSSPDIAHDIANPSSPRTAFGYIAEGLRRRIAAGAGPLTILSCDNLQHNGNTACRAFNSFFAAQDTELAAWAEKNITYPNCMVDRITPATTPDDITRLNAKNGTQDAAPVYCEDFIQWVVEDNFIAGRPDWESVGVEMTDDVTSYEMMKLSLLNASHTLLSYPSFLTGYRKVDEAMSDERIVRFVREFMDTDITHLLVAPPNTDLELYKQTLVERFANHSVSDQIARLCYDGLSKFPVYIVPNLSKMLEMKADLTRVAFLIAAYRHYLKTLVDDKGVAYEVAEPWMNPHDEGCIQSDNVTDFFNLSAFQAVKLADYPDFVTLYKQMVEAIATRGTMTTLEQL